MVICLECNGNGGWFTDKNGDRCLTGPGYGEELPWAMCPNCDGTDNANDEYKGEDTNAI